MKHIDQKSTNFVSGGNPLVIGAEAVAVGVGVYVAPQMIYDGTLFFNNIGSSVGEWVFDQTHPDPLGQMTYNSGDFGGSFILSAFPDEFPPYG